MQALAAHLTTAPPAPWPRRSPTAATTRASAILARALGLGASRFGARPEVAAALAAAWQRARSGSFTVKLRLVRAMGDVADGSSRRRWPRPRVTPIRWCARRR